MSNFIHKIAVREGYVSARQKKADEFSHMDAGPFGYVGKAEERLLNIPNGQVKYAPPPSAFAKIMQAIKAGAGKAKGLAKGNPKATAAIAGGTTLAGMLAAYLGLKGDGKTPSSGIPPISLRIPVDPNEAAKRDLAITAGGAVGGGVLGAGLGAGIGALSDRKHRLRNAIIGVLGGGAAGALAGGHLGHSTSLISDAFNKNPELAKDYNPKGQKTAGHKEAGRSKSQSILSELRDRPKKNAKQPEPAEQVQLPPEQQPVDDQAIADRHEEGAKEASYRNRFQNILKMAALQQPIAPQPQLQPDPNDPSVQQAMAQVQQQQQEQAAEQQTAQAEVEKQQKTIELKKRKLDIDAELASIQGAPSAITEKSAGLAGQAAIGGLAGAGIGAILPAADKKKRLRNALLGVLAGAPAGMAIGQGLELLKPGETPAAGAQIPMPGTQYEQAAMDAANQGKLDEFVMAKIKRDSAPDINKSVDFPTASKNPQGTAMRA